MIAYNNPDTYEGFLEYLASQPEVHDAAAGKGTAWCRRVFELFKLLIKLLMCAKKVDQLSQPGSGSNLLSPAIADSFQLMDWNQLSNGTLFSQLSR